MERGMTLPVVGSRAVTRDFSASRLTGPDSKLVHFCGIKATVLENK